MQGGWFIGALGKVPQYAEFVRLRPPGDLASSFETWLASGFEGAHMRYGDTWRTKFAEGAPHAFVWTHRSQPDMALCGVIAPSRDAVGRSYPITVFAALPLSLFGDTPHAIPLAFGDFLDGAYQAVNPASSSSSQPLPLDQAVQWLSPPSYESVASAAMEYDAWCDGTAPDQAWLPLFENGASGAQHALAMLALALEPFQGVERPATKLGVRLSLGSGGAAAAVVWLDVIRRMARWRTTVPVTFWSMQSGSLIVHFGDVPPSTLAELWLPDSDNESLVPVDGIHAAGIPSRLSQRIENLLHQGHGRFADVLHALESWAHSLPRPQ